MLQNSYNWHAKTLISFSTPAFTSSTTYLVAVGSHFSSILTNIRLCHHERIWFQQCPSSLSPTHYCRYMEYTFTCFSNVDKPQKFLSYMNGRHHNIKLIAKYPNYKTLPFLYCNDTNNQVNFVTSIYKKIHWPWY